MAKSSRAKAPKPETPKDAGEGTAKPRKSAAAKAKAIETDVAKAPKKTPKASKVALKKLPKPRIKTSEPIFAVSDVPATVRYYQQVLGFSGDWFWGEPPIFGGVRRGDIGIMFHHQPHIQPHVAGHEHYFFVKNVESLYQEHIAAGANIIDPIADRPWGLREYYVRDLNGYHLRFGEFTAKIEERKKKRKKKSDK